MIISAEPEMSPEEIAVKKAEVQAQFKKLRQG
jgi:hypothetical protein